MKKLERKIKKDKERKKDEAIRKKDGEYRSKNIKDEQSVWWSLPKDR